MPLEVAPGNLHDADPHILIANKGRVCPVVAFQSRA